MTVRVTLPAVLALALAPTVAAQIPDSLAHLGLPDNPLEFARELAREVREGYQSVRVLDMYRAGGCVSDGGWTATAFEEMYRLAEADPAMLTQVATTLGLTIGHRGAEYEFPCHSDLPGFEAWLVGQLRRRWEAGALSSPGYGLAGAAMSLLMAVEGGQDPEIPALFEAIALDADVDDQIRYEATMGMMRHRESRLRGHASMTDEDANELRLDVVERMVREHFETLPVRWIRESLAYLDGNGRFSREEATEMFLRLGNLGRDGSRDPGTRR